MYEQVLGRIKERAASGEIFLTIHAEEKMKAEDLNIYDVEAILLSGRVTERQKDTFEYKYVIVGQTTTFEEATVVSKMVGDLVVITVFLGTL